MNNDFLQVNEPLGFSILRRETSKSQMLLTLGIWLTASRTLGDAGHVAIASVQVCYGAACVSQVGWRLG